MNVDYQKMPRVVTQTVEPNGDGLLDQVMKATAASRHSLDDIHRLAQTSAKSGMFKMTPDQIETLMLLCQAEGIEPIKALAMYDVFNGKPAMKSLYMLARHQAAGGVFKWVETSDTAAECFFSHRTACPDGITVRWTIDDAKRAGLTGKDNWKGYSEDMLVWRVVARGVRRSNPACLFGLDVPEAQEVEPPTAETKARESLVTHLAGRRESPKDSHPAVAETAAELRKAPEPEKPAPAPAEPATAWGKVIADATLHTNEAIAQLAEENPANVGLRAAAIKPQQVINGVLNEFVGRGIIDEEKIKNERGKRDNARAAATMTSLWDEDSGDVEAAIAKYLSDKIQALMKPTAPVAQGELAMA